MSEIEKDELGTEPVAQAETTEAVEYTEEKFLKDLLWTSRAYLIIVIASAIIAAAGSKRLPAYQTGKISLSTTFLWEKSGLLPDNPTWNMPLVLTGCNLLRKKLTVLTA